MSDQRIGTCTVCLTDAQPAVRAPFDTAGPSVLAWAGGRLGRRSAWSAGAPLRASGARAGLAGPAAGSAARPGSLPAAASSRADGLGEPLGALAGLLVALGPGPAARGPV